jgi:outer membrane protein assembly factor BamB
VTAEINLTENSQPERSNIFAMSSIPFQTVVICGLLLAVLDLRPGNSAEPASSATPSAELLWQRSLDNELITYPPALWRDRVFIGTRGGAVVAFNENGEKLWERHLGHPTSVHLAGRRNGDVVCAFGSDITVLDKDGALKWTKNIGTATFAPAIGFDGSIVVGIGVFAHKLYGLSADGEFQFKTSLASMYGLMTAPVLLPDGGIAIGIEEKLGFVKVSRTGEVLWSIPWQNINEPMSVNNAGDIFAPSSENQMSIYSKDGNFLGGYQSDTGEPTSVIISEDGDILTCEKVGLFYGARPKIRRFTWDGDSKWEQEVDGDCKGMCVARDGSSYFGTMVGTLYSLSESGQIMNSLTLATNLSAPNLSASGHLYIASDNGTLFCLKVPTGLAHSSWPMTYGGPALDNSVQTGLLADAEGLTVVGKPGTTVSLETSSTATFTNSTTLQTFELEDDSVKFVPTEKMGFFRLKSNK